MSAGDPDDVLRSLRRYVSLILGSPPWRVRVQRTRVADDERPVAIIEESSPLTEPFSRAGHYNQGDVQQAQTFAVVCYPTFNTAAPVAESAERARQLKRLVHAGFTRGLVTDDVPAKNIGMPWRVPVYDFATVPIAGSPADRSGPADPYMHADLARGFNTRAIQDPLDEFRWTVVANVPLSWWAAGRIPPPAPLTERVPGAWGGVPTLPQRVPPAAG